MGSKMNIFNGKKMILFSQEILNYLASKKNITWC